VTGYVNWVAKVYIPTRAGNVAFDAKSYRLSGPHGTLPNGYGALFQWELRDRNVKLNIQCNKLLQLGDYQQQIR
jgi:hypothetical protein